MSEERDHHGLGKTQDAHGEPDEEPTLETEERTDDEEPTLETEGNGSVEKRAEAEASSRPGGGWGSRLERMTAAKKARRRRLLGQFWLAAVPVLLLVAMAMVLLAVYGGQDGDDSRSATTVTVARTADKGSALLLFSNGGELVAGALLHPWESGGVVLAIPGATLLESEGAFRELRVTYQDAGHEAVKAALADALDMPIGPAAVIEWSELVTALELVVPDDVSIEVMVVDQGEIVAQVVRDAVAGQGNMGSSGGWSELPLGGEAVDVLDAIAIDAESMAKDVWSADTLRGTSVDGDGFWYLEPDIESAKALLFVNVDPVAISVEIRDGAGVEGAARTAGSLFEAAGFELAPMSYAQDYPGVEKTQIMISGGNAAEAQEIRALLGVGDIVVDATLSDNVVIVVLGKDYGVEPVTTTLGSTETGE